MSLEAAARRPIWPASPRYWVTVRLQRKSGRIDPDSFTHGTSEQRTRWFTRGYESGEPGVCDTFSADSL